MQRILNSLQEIAPEVETHYLRTQVVARATISVIHRYCTGNPDGYHVHMTFASERTGETLAIVSREFDSLDELAERLGIRDEDEVWEALV